MRKVIKEAVWTHLEASYAFLDSIDRKLSRFEPFSLDGFE